ncbi:MAG: hypothetical protein D3923_10665, partial [Candidatus Electrothrix sp. AR3]|nr:hypothetical protein [Candidatus Electrothrix sp. AR3]
MHNDPQQTRGAMNTQRYWLGWLLCMVLSLSGCAELNPISTGTETAGHAGDIGVRNITLYDVEQRKVLPGMEIVISNGKITSVQSQPQPATDVNTVIDGSAMLALPGFVNTHTHLWQHLAR